MKPVAQVPMWIMYLYAIAGECEGRLFGRLPRFSLLWARSANHFHFYSSDKARRELDYNPIDFRAMIQRTADALTRDKML